MQQPVEWKLAKQTSHVDMISLISGGANCRESLENQNKETTEDDGKKREQLGENRSRRGYQNKCVAWKQAKNQNLNYRKEVTQKRLQM